LENQKAISFRKLSLVSTLTTYLLIFVGGLVRVSGAGLGCPDWPKCFGSWIPPLSRDQIPAGFSPETFNITLAWIEYVNRLLGMIVGLLILATAIMAIMYFRSHKKILIPAMLAAFLVAVQGWYGSVVVATKLHPATVSIHLVLALIIVSLLIYTTQSVNYLSVKAGKSGFTYRAWFIVLWICIVIQIILGTQLRSEIEILLDNFPLLFDNQIIPNIGMVNYIHSIFGVILTGVTILIALKIFALKTDNKNQLRLLSGLSVLLLLAQIFLGSGMEIFGVPQILQVFHLWIASLFVGIILILYVELKHSTGVENVS